MVPMKDKQAADKREVDRVAAALHQAEERRFAAFRALEDARAALSEARRNASVNAVAQALGEESASVMTVVDGRREVERLEAEYEDPKALVSALVQTGHAARMSLEIAKLTVNSALKEVLQISIEVKAEVARFRAAVAAFAKAEATMKPCGGQARFLCRSNTRASSARTTATTWRRMQNG